MPRKLKPRCPRCGYRAALVRTPLAPHTVCEDCEHRLRKKARAASFRKLTEALPPIDPLGMAPVDKTVPPR